MEPGSPALQADFHCLSHQGSPLIYAQVLIQWLEEQASHWTWRSAFYSNTARTSLSGELLHCHNQEGEESENHHWNHWVLGHTTFWDQKAAPPCSQQRHVMSARSTPAKKSACACALCSAHKASSPWGDAAGTCVYDSAGWKKQQKQPETCPFLSFNKSSTKWMFVRTHIAFGTWTARGLGNEGFSFSAFQEGTLEGEWNEITHGIYCMHHLLNCHCPMDLVVSYLNDCNIFTPRFFDPKFFPLQSILCVVLKTHL